MTFNMSLNSDDQVCFPLPTDEMPGKERHRTFCKDILAASENTRL